MNIVRTLTEAEDWFLSHAEGEALCVAVVAGSEVSQKVDTYQKARQFFQDAKAHGAERE